MSRGSSRPAAWRRSEQDEIHAYAGAPRGDSEEASEETDERPIVPLRRAPARAAAEPRRRPAPNAPRRRPPSPQRNGTGGAHWGRRILAVVALLVIVAALYALNATFQPFHGDGEGSVAVVIPQGADSGEIGEILAAKGVVDSARFFELKATVSGERDNLRPGRYTLQRGMTNAAAIDALQAAPKAPKAVETVDVRLLEGPSRKENAPVVDDSKKVEGELRARLELQDHAPPHPRARRAEGHEDRRGLPVPRHLHAAGRLDREPARQGAARHVRGELQAGRPQSRPSARTSRATTC